MSAENVGHRRAGAALVGHVHHVELRVLLEDLHFQPIERAAAGRGKGDLALVRLHIGDQLADGVGREVQPGDQDAWGVGANRNRGQILVRLDAHVGSVDAGVDREGADIAEKGRVAVRRRAGCSLCADHARRARPIVDHDLLAEDLADAVLDGAGDKIGSAAGRERHDHHDGSIGIVAGVLGRGSCTEQQQQRAAERRRDSDSNSLPRCHGSFLSLNHGGGLDRPYPIRFIGPSRDRGKCWSVLEVSLAVRGPHGVVRSECVSLKWILFPSPLWVQ